MLTLTAPCFEHQGSWRHRAAGLWVGRPQGFEPLRACSPSASTPTTGHNFSATSCHTEMLHTAHFFAVCSSQVQCPRGQIGTSAPTCTCCPPDGCFVRQVRAHFSRGKPTQCFEHCPQLWAHQSPHFPHMLQEPRFDPWAALGAKPHLFVRRFLAAGGWFQVRRGGWQAAVVGGSNSHRVQRAFRS